tara:strand:+ start:4812 stop:5726 length:915 start_codon:yes stop_codon:yes gene_type:complete
MKKLLAKKSKKTVSEDNQYKKKIFNFCIFGSDGLLGKHFLSELKKENVFKVARRNSNYNIDLKNFDKIEKLFKIFKFNNVINCAAKINLDYCENSYKEAKKINTSLPKFLTKMSFKYNFKLIQISTDHFYKSKKKILHKETDKIYAINNYSKTKKEAEKFVKKNPNNLIIRTNFTGRGKSSRLTFVEWIYKSLKKSNKINLFNDMYTSTLDVKYCSKIIVDLIKKNANGIYNVASNNALSKKDFAILFAKKMRKKINFSEISSKKLQTKRGKFLGLNVKKTEKKLKIKLKNSTSVINSLAREFK